MKDQKWVLDCPQPQCGNLAKGCYNAGPMLADDQSGSTNEDSKMQVICNVNKQDFDAYVAALQQQEIRHIFENQLGEDCFLGFSYAGKNYHVQYWAKRGELRVIEDIATTPLARFGYTAKGSRKTRIYQYGLYYDPNNDVTDTTVNCGMLYIVHLSDNSLFMIDGGHIFQWNEQAFAAFWRFLHQIIDTPEDGIIRIAGWYFTHAHNDHLDGCTKLLSRYHDRILVERVLHGFPSYAHCVGGYSVTAFDLKRLLCRYHPNALCLKLHTGQTFSLCDMQLTVLYAKEDAAKAEALSELGLQDFNDTSTVVKLTIDGKNVMMLGDTNVGAQAILAQNSDPALWKSELLQVSHHCFNYLSTLYGWIQAPMAMMPNSYNGAHQPENLPKLADVERYLTDGAIYYEGNETTGFEADENGFHAVYHAPVIGGEWDRVGFQEVYARFAK